MTFQWAAGITAAGCSLWSIVPYVRGIRAGKRPSPVSWLIFAVLCAEFTAALARAGGRATLGLPAAETVGCTLIAVLAWRAARARAGRALDAEHMGRKAATMLLAGVAAALAGWWFAGPVLAAVLLIGVDLTAGAVTVIDVWHDPESETLSSWCWYGTGEILATVSAVGAGWIFWASSLSGLSVAASIVAAARLRQAPQRGVPQWALICAAFVLVAVLGTSGELVARLAPAPPAPAAPVLPVVAIAHLPGLPGRRPAPPAVRQAAQAAPLGPVPSPAPAPPPSPAPAYEEGAQ